MQEKLIANSSDCSVRNLQEECLQENVKNRTDETVVLYYIQLEN